MILIVILALTLLWAALHLIVEGEVMKHSFAIEKHDIGRIDKLNALTNIETFWDDVRRYTRYIMSDHSIGRWQCLAEIRYEELKGEK